MSAAYKTTQTMSAELKNRTLHKEACELTAIMASSRITAQKPKP